MKNASDTPETLPFDLSRFVGDAESKRAHRNEFTPAQRERLLKAFGVIRACINRVESPRLRIDKKSGRVTAPPPVSMNEVDKNEAFSAALLALAMGEKDKRARFFDSERPLVFGDVIAIFRAIRRALNLNRRHPEVTTAQDVLELLIDSGDSTPFGMDSSAPRATPALYATPATMREWRKGFHFFMRYAFQSDQSRKRKSGLKGHLRFLRHLSMIALGHSRAPMARDQFKTRMSDLRKYLAQGAKNAPSLKSFSQVMGSLYAPKSAKGSHSRVAMFKPEKSKDWGFDASLVAGANSNPRLAKN
jgi:hypothetical protein